MGGKPERGIGENHSARGGSDSVESAATWFYGFRKYPSRAYIYFHPSVMDYHHPVSHHPLPTI
jgi:hypothetical protein